MPHNTKEKIHTTNGSARAALESMSPKNAAIKLLMVTIAGLFIPTGFLVVTILALFYGWVCLQFIKLLENKNMTVKKWVELGTAVAIVSVSFRLIS